MHRDLSVLNVIATCCSTAVITKQGLDDSVKNRIALSTSPVLISLSAPPHSVSVVCPTLCMA